MEWTLSQYVFQKNIRQIRFWVADRGWQEYNEKNENSSDSQKGAENMNVEQDYIMRMIKEFANVLGRLLFNKKKPMYELDVTNRYHVGDDLYTRLCRMADEGKINEAENLLYEEMVPGWIIWRWRWHFMRI